MCGFVGFVSTDRSYDRRSVLRNMADSIIHRGPDSDGYFDDEVVALGFRRLALVGIEGGDQPMQTEDGNYVICFNGEIYNHAQLREQLRGLGYTFRTKCDTEVLLKGYQEWGSSVLDRLRGMFAFVVYDRKQHTLFFARDPFGIKPLYFYKVRDGILFASEAKAFLHHPEFEKRLNENLLPLYMCFEYIPTEQTLFVGVEKLQAGHCATWAHGKLEVRRYCEFRYNIDDSLSMDDWASRIAACMAESSEAHAAADVEVGCFLSAGVDSSLVAAHAKDLMDVRTFSIGYAEEEFSELGAARELAERIGVRNIAGTISAADFFNSAGAVQYHMDEPLPNPSAVPLYHLARLAAREVKGVMSGEGADELFGGYPYYQECLSYEPYMRVPRALRMLAGNVAAKMPQFHGRRFLMRGRYSLPQRYIRSNYVFNFSDCGQYLRDMPDCPTPDSITAPVFAQVAHEDEVTQMQFADLAFWLQYDILQKADRMSMASSLELRVPFLDKHVLDLALQIPSRYRVTHEQTKPALRKAAEATLPKKTADMPKIGFITPLAVWLRRPEFADRVRDAFNSRVAAELFNTKALNGLLDAHLEGKGSNMKKIWSIYSFLAWHDEFFQKR
ncbi:asparagine synthase (glutamine-hydrolyzing) [Adlercreutzia sp. ZJ154]|uniref:asparagine synthase (glutamine-hydrolyzing) n=1 Tax=Adlercreutzia sp. ZJ154 TaxID=2709790 RepID=UPI0013ECE277|nr:asparagine synthase (glutamine-hydrolyzing) [Adlercreutzia sp. ZJ154]